MADDVSVVMVSYHTGPVLERAIELALAQDCLRELIIVDNGNPDEVRNQIRAWADREEKLGYYTGHGNVGFAAGCNIGAKHAKGNYLLFLNPDCLLPQNSLSKAVNQMKKHKEAWLAGICLLGPEGKKREANNKRNLLCPIVAMSEVFQLWRIDPDRYPRINIKESNDEEEAQYIPAISGAFMLIKRKRYEEVGGMDQSYFFHVEDLDFCKEIHVQGGKVLYIPSIKATHIRSSSDVTSFFVEWHKTKGFLRYFKKHYSHLYLGIFYFVTSMAIWTRFVLRLPKIFMRGIFSKSRKENLKNQEKVA